MEKFKQILETRNERAVEAARDRENAPERPLDELVVDDQEILGQSVHLRSSVYEGAKNTVNSLDKQFTRVRNENPAAKARDTYLSYRKDRIGLKIERLEHQITKDPTSRQGKRRQKELEMFKKRLEWREGQSNKRENKYTTRTEKYTKRSTNREKEQKEQVDKYIAKKIEAMRRKEARKLLKSEGIGRLSVIERNKYLATMPTEAKKRLLREAILSVREANIRKGKLDHEYQVDESKPKRKIGHYERTV